MGALGVGAEQRQHLLAQRERQLGTRSSTAGRYRPGALLIRAKAPLRISFAGGGTDVPPFPQEEGGASSRDDHGSRTAPSARATTARSSIESLDFDGSRE